MPARASTSSQRAANRSGRKANGSIWCRRSVYRRSMPRIKTTPCGTGPFGCFFERAQAGDPHFAPDKRQAATMAAICRRLDGIPLALELAAARVAAFGIEELAARLDDRFQLLTGGRRTALARHQTLRATLDWSFELLPEAERVILRRLAVFAGWFTLEAASAVVASAETHAAGRH